MYLGRVDNQEDLMAVQCELCLRDFRKLRFSKMGKRGGSTPKERKQAEEREKRRAQENRRQK